MTCYDVLDLKNSKAVTPDGKSVVCETVQDDRTLGPLGLRFGRLRELLQGYSGDFLLSVAAPCGRILNFAAIFTNLSLSYE